MSVGHLDLYACRKNEKKIKKWGKFSLARQTLEKWQWFPEGHVIVFTYVSFGVGLFASFQPTDA
jgi:hypothetical protein